MTVQTVLVTGASGGIGAALARSFADRGHTIIITGRNRDALAALASDLGSAVGDRIFPADLSAPGGAEALHAAVLGAGLTVDILVNNAGFGILGDFPGEDLAAHQRLIAVNVTALTTLTGLFSPGMLARGRGGVLNVASLAAYAPGPGMATYYASKAFVLSFTEALAAEWARTGVTATALCPGLVRTGFQDAAGMSHLPALARTPAKSPEDVADAAVAGFFTGKRVVIPGAANTAFAGAARMAPRGLTAKILGRFQRRTPDGDEPAAP